MNPNFVDIGPSAKLVLGGLRSVGTLYDCLSGRWRATGQRVETTDTNNLGGTSVKVGLGTFTLEVDAQSAVTSTGNPFAAPYSLTLGSYVYCAFYPAGTANVGGQAPPVYIVPYLCIQEFDGDFVVQGSPAERINFKGESSGGWQFAGPTTTTGAQFAGNTGP
jgi:hypothetical protein